MLGTVMGWVALRAAHQVGMKVGNSPEATGDYIIKQMSTNLGNQGGSWMHTLYKNATGIRVLYELGRDDDVAKRAFKSVEDLVKKDNTAFSHVLISATYSLPPQLYLLNNSLYYIASNN
jgi:hypothetical protein